MNKKKSRLYGLVFGIPEQKAIIDKVCFGSCKKIIVGSMHLDGIVPMLFCRQPAAKCPAFDREMDEPLGDVNGEAVYLRKLKEKD